VITIPTRNGIIDGVLQVVVRRVIGVVIFFLSPPGCNEHDGDMLRKDGKSLSQW